MGDLFERWSLFCAIDNQTLETAAGQHQRLAVSRNCVYRVPDALRGMSCVDQMDKFS
ncbi:uncharacterized protein PHALS_05195 [Plasmopara halstedii]|uniref:Uncharacterized protein n=1 Tax=Plasmopara halstedii TaxID=4781 RepID=A0A0N7L7S2_PLAHL|nr:uncharacterized protein PHALS_05195 [Plasmopara halstedii]CEG47867.1 hypothetical protein PHALS_05195 [Plasmopara halstedii]|eukprot:XP_024584236.1 hypothetical protein PHALS_05195 [Plasmopara halstedii]